MKRAPIPWSEIRAVARYVERDESKPEHIGRAVHKVWEWLNPKAPPPDPNQLTMLGKW
jgi:hypothetical protein